MCQCGVLKEKLDSLLKTLNEESQASSVPHSTPPPTIAEEQEEAEAAPLQTPTPSPQALPPPPAPLHHPAHHAPCSPRAGASSPPAAAIFKPREQLMLRANSLKKAIRQIIEHTEKGAAARREAGGWDAARCGTETVFVCFGRAAVDEQNAQTQQQLFPLNRDDEEEGLVEEEEEEETEADKMSLQSSYSVKQRNPRRGQWSLIHSWSHGPL